MLAKFALKPWIIKKPCLNHLLAHRSRSSVVKQALCRGAVLGLACGRGGAALAGFSRVRSSESTGFIGVFIVETVDRELDSWSWSSWSTAVSMISPWSCWLPVCRVREPAGGSSVVLSLSLSSGLHWSLAADWPLSAGPTTPWLADRELASSPLPSSSFNLRALSGMEVLRWGATECEGLLAWGSSECVLTGIWPLQSEVWLGESACRLPVSIRFDSGSAFPISFLAEVFFADSDERVSAILGTTTLAVLLELLPGFGGNDGFFLSFGFGGGGGLDDNSPVFRLLEVRIFSRAAGLGFALLGLEDETSSSFSFSFWTQEGGTLLWWSEFTTLSPCFSGLDSGCSFAESLPISLVPISIKLPLLLLGAEDGRFDGLLSTSCTELGFGCSLADSMVASHAIVSIWLPLLVGGSGGNWVGLLSLCSTELGSGWGFTDSSTTSHAACSIWLPLLVVGGGGGGGNSVGLLSTCFSDRHFDCCITDSLLVALRMRLLRSGGGGGNSVGLRTNLRPERLVLGGTSWRSWLGEEFRLRLDLESLKCCRLSWLGMAVKLWLCRILERGREMACGEPFWSPPSTCCVPAEPSLLPSAEEKIITQIIHTFSSGLSS